MMAKLSFSAWVLTLFLAGNFSRAAAQSAGIYADFNTSKGTFTCQLDYQHAPKAVANFIGLATGTRPWINEATGQIQNKPFYNGLTFHRVVAGFVIQAGSPNGLGNDGPGYVFPDEFDASVRHDAAGVLSCANTGTNSNGSQFFVTVEPTPWLNDVHTIFGRVVSGLDIVNTINQVPTDSSNKPIDPVLIQSVMIRRIGAAAEAFNINGQNLPVIAAAPVWLQAGASQVTLTYTNHAYSAYHLLSSTNLSAWTVADLGINLGPVQSPSLLLPQDAPQRFYSMTRVQYPSSTLAPATLRTRTLTMHFNQGGNTMTIQFDANEGGTYTFPPNAPAPRVTWGLS